MLFTTKAFFIFFPITVLLYFLAPRKFKPFFLLAASYFFYMFADIKLIGFLLFATAASYVFGILIGSAKSPGRKKAYLVAGITIVLSVLLVFKYLNFFADSIASISVILGFDVKAARFSLILPIGISFYTFMSLGYLIDVYRDKIGPERNIITYALFVAFFPQLLAGPIGRAGSLIPQFHGKGEFDYQRLMGGVKLMAFGIFKKAVIADRAAILVSSVFDNPHGYTGLSMIVAVVLFAIQLYCDFSGYSDTAIGAAKILGIDLMNNFDTPFYSRSVREFWRRWHISLTTWFRDYLYIPLGGNRTSKFRHYVNIFLTYFLSGLWHGANWTFAIWGALNGFYYIFSQIFSGARDRAASLIKIDRLPRLRGLAQVVMVFLLIDFSFIFFRANKVQDAFHIIMNLATGVTTQVRTPSIVLNLGLNGFEMSVLVLSIIMMEMIHLYMKNSGFKKFIDGLFAPLRWIMSYVFIMWILFFSVRISKGFIYFQF
ncbi:MAG: MBOAT family protein [Spirochaetes bacterium]|jgi:D-alanyl-lipoteichoic acid acyltransferase DltB (MBOAT superfamily)|nr:MBOAT family protein [Spirochaetota bacterium]